MPRVIGIDPGTSAWGFYGIEVKESTPTKFDVFLDMEFETKNWEKVRRQLQEIVEMEVDLIVGPSAYGTPFKLLEQLTDDERALMLLNTKHRHVGVSDALSILEESGSHVVLLPGVKHLPTVPTFRKFNRIDMGTADKVAAVAYTVVYLTKKITTEELKWPSFIHCELGFGFNSFISVSKGKIKDGIGGSYSHLGYSSGGALDSELAYLLGRIPKKIIFRGGVRFLENKLRLNSDPRILEDAFFEAVLKDIAAANISVPECSNIILSGRRAAEGSVHRRLSEHFPDWDIIVLEKPGIASVASVGSAYLGFGYLETIFSDVFNRMEIADSSGSVLDFLGYQAEDEKAPIHIL